MSLKTEIRLPIAVFALWVVAAAAALLLANLGHDGKPQDSKRDALQKVEQSKDERILSLLGDLDKAAKAGRNDRIAAICRDLVAMGKPILPHVSKILFGQAYPRNKLELLKVLGRLEAGGGIDLLINGCRMDLK
jgi:hypothetical protein